MEDRLRKILVYAVISLTVVIILVIGVMLRDVFFTKDIPQTPAEQAFTQADALVKKDPRNADYLFARAKAYADLGRSNAALADLDLAIKQRSAAPMLHYTKAQIYMDLSDEKAAIKELKQELIVTENKNELAWFDLGRIYSTRKNYTEAIICFKNALMRMESGADAHYELAKAYEGLGQYALAAQEYKEVLKYIPDHADAQAGLEALYAKTAKVKSK